jgi:hypothetical protein
MMLSHYSLRAPLLRAVHLFSFLLISCAGFCQSEYEVELELLAQQRVLPAVGPGFQSIVRGPAGRFYVLTSPSPAVSIYDSTGKRLGQVPGIPKAKAPTAIVFGVSLDVDDAGRMAVADAGANAVKLYAADGTLIVSFHVAQPISVALLPSGEIAVTSQSADHLVSIYDASGKFLRAFGDPEDLSDRPDLNSLVNVCQLGRDAAANLYIAFEYLPEPTVRKYDPQGYANLEIALKTLDFQSVAQAARREIAREEPGGVLTPHRIITGMGVDPTTGEVWLSFGTLLLHFDKDGNRLDSYRTYTPDGARLEATTILVEPNRLLLGQDPLGVYEFARPDKTDNTGH